MSRDRRSSREHGSAKGQERRSVSGFLMIIALGLVVFFVARAGSGEEVSHFGDTVAAAESLYTAALETHEKDREILAQRAAALYEEAVAKEGRWNGYLLYNLGTAYQLSGDLGRAILNYRRAEQLVPRLDDLKANLSVALAERKDKIEPGQKEEIMRGLFFWHYILGAATRRTVFAITFVLIWVFLGMNSLRSSGTAKALAGIATVFSLALGLSIGSDFLSQQQRNRGVLISEDVMARKGPGQSYAPAYEGGLHEGTEIRILEHDIGWFRVGLIDGSQCWVPEGSFEVY